MDEAVHDLIKVYLAQIQSAIKISKIICEHGNREELTGDDIICGLVYRLMTPMPEDEIVEALNTAENFLNDEESDSDDEFDVIYDLAVFSRVVSPASSSNARSNLPELSFPISNCISLQLSRFFIN